MVISLRALCIGRREIGKGVTSDEIQVNTAKFAQIDLVDSLQNKVRYQTKRHTILVGCGILVATTAETKAHVYLFGQNDQFPRESHSTSH